ncbi:hypothetical protein GF339_04515 [candidate division KSB3 bacterium]|uniref:SGNH hydrolase-type esterase domain-containing protein n=1 Tax=candidate division KSB3 bacterium TaxID=2044937 RepID=A0A9D5JT96_9BACT|nr:hypothetical protein [candidate division KSB3 bacterium]MBD3323822.1 hypothetical protein [candidate division KSB3 bacterium]
MQHIQKVLGIFLVGLSLLGGCQDTQHPTAVKVIDGRQMQTAPRQVADDTADSDVASPQYPEGTTVIVAIGDSITYGWDSTVGGYPVILQNKLLAAGYNAVVLNEGVPGERTPATEARFLEVIAGADIALIMIGINDIIDPQACPEPFNCQTINHIEALLDKALISKTVPLVSTVTPANPTGPYEWANYPIRSLNSQIYQIAAERNVLLVDNYRAIMSNGGSTLYDDNLHFTDQGYGIIAQQWYDALIANDLLTTDQE